MGWRIESVQVRAERLEFRRPYVTAAGTIGHREIVELEIATSEGLHARGETTALSLRGGPQAGAIVAELTGSGARCLIEASEADLDPLAETSSVVGSVAAIIAGCRAAGLSREALCALDIALFDLAGKLCGEPLFRLLGAAEAQPVECNATLIAGEPAAVAADAGAWAADGFTSFKLKAGFAGDVEAVAAVGGAIGEAASIRVDANGAWDVTTAIEKLAAMGRIELAEQPCADVLDLVSVRESTPTPIAADESVVDADSADAVVRLGAADLATVKLAKVGGIAAATEIAGKLPVYVSSALDGPIGITAAAHLAAAIRARGGDAGLAHGLATERLFAAWPGGGARLEGAMLHPPDGPGLGLG